MRKMLLLATTVLALNACSSGPDKTVFTGGNPTPTQNAMDASAWRIGPVVWGENRSACTPTSPSATPDGGLEFDIPYSEYAGQTDNWMPACHIHYNTFNYGPLTGKTEIRMKYRIEGPEGYTIRPRTGPVLPWLITLYFQQRGDDWTAAGKFETYRWYATFATQQAPEAGEHEIVAPLQGVKWTALLTSDSVTSPQAFQDAINNAQAVGFVLGGGDGYGHGVFADKPGVKIVVTSFTVN